MVAVSLKKFFFQAEDGIRDRSPSRGLGDVYKRQMHKGEILRKGDKIAWRDGTIDDASLIGESVACDQLPSNNPYIRRIRAPRKHRFDGMTLRDVLTELRHDWHMNGEQGYSSDYVAPRFAREVRRRDALRMARK